MKTRCEMRGVKMGVSCSGGIINVCVSRVCGSHKNKCSLENCQHVFSGDHGKDDSRFHEVVGKGATVAPG